MRRSLSSRTRFALTCSAVFHFGLGTVLAMRAAALPRPVEIRAGLDSRASTSWQLSMAAAEPTQLDSPVVISAEVMRIADRRLVRVPEPRIDLQAPPVEMAEALLKRLEAPVEAPQVAAPATPPEAAEPTPAPPAPAPPAPQPAPAAAARDAGADSRPQREPRVVPPVFTDARPPVFPSEALQRGMSGTVMLRITVDERGRVTEVSVARSSGHAALDASAVRAVRTWRGRPATRDGAPYRSVWHKPIRFE